jgi:hypothetical protein
MTRIPLRIIQVASPSSDRRSSGLCVALIVSVATCVKRAVDDKLLCPSKTSMIRISVPFSRRCVAKLWRSVWSVTRLVRPAAFRPAGGMQHGLIDRMIFVTTREQIKPRSGEPPVGAQDAQQLGRQHHVAIRALAVAHLDDAAGAVDVFDP